MNRVLIAILFLVACGPTSPETGPTSHLGGSGGEGGHVATDAGGVGADASTCVEWDYASGGPKANQCPEESERCAGFGVESVPACCPPEKPCAPPATGAGRCDPMLGTFLGWCCRPDCD